MVNGSDLLMLAGVMAFCADCGDERLFVPVAHGELCCTTCDAAVFSVLAEALPAQRERRRSA
jgi:uncharacterized protein (DUF983 family)